jgi:hypothetical protein
MRAMKRARGFAFLRRLPLAGRLALVPLLAACSQRGCASCVGYAPERPVAELDRISVDVDQVYKPLTVTVSLLDDVADSSSACPSLPKGTTIRWNGAPGTTTTLGEGHIRSTRGGEWTECRGPRATFVTTAPLGTMRSPDGRDRVEIADGASLLTVVVPAGRPRVAIPAPGELEVVFDGLEGKLHDLTTCIAPASDERDCSTLEDRAVRGDSVRGRFRAKKPGPHVVTGIATLTPVATCHPAKTACAARVSYTVSVPFTAP